MFVRGDHVRETANVVYTPGQLSSSSSPANNRYGRVIRVLGVDSKGFITRGITHGTMGPKYYEDIEVGATYETGGYEMTYDEVIEFAQRYDPQPFHTEAEPEVDSIFDDLVASGWHTAAVSMRLLVECFNNDVAVLASPGMDKVYWPNPVYPGDTLSFQLEILDKRRSESNPSLGILSADWTTYNQEGVEVLDAANSIFVETRS